MIKNITRSISTYTAHIKKSLCISHELKEIIKTSDLLHQLFDRNATNAIWWYRIQSRTR